MPDLNAFSTDSLCTMISSPDWLRELDHTADIGIAVQADDLKTLFERAAHGMLSLLTDIESVEAKITRDVRASGGDLQELMRNWLSEVNFLHIQEHLVFRTFEITSFTEQELAATIAGESIDRERHDIFTEIKAVTYHGLSIEKENGLWHAEIIFDM